MKGIVQKMSHGLSTLRVGPEIPTVRHSGYLKVFVNNLPINLPTINPINLLNGIARAQYAELQDQ